MATSPILLFQRQFLHHKRMHVRLPTHTQTTHTPCTRHTNTHNMNTNKEHEQKHRHNTLPHTQHFRQTGTTWIAVTMITWYYTRCMRCNWRRTTLTFGTLRKNHIVSTAFETIAKKKQNNKKRCPRAVSNVPVSKKRRKKTISVIVDKLPAGNFISITVLIHSKKKVPHQITNINGFINSKTKDPVCNHFRVDGKHDGLLFWRHFAV